MKEGPRHIAVCILRRGPLLLVGEGFDKIKQERFYRPLGGGIEPGESAERAIVREIFEELGEPVRNLRHVGEIDNHFVYEGRPGWEVVQVFEAEFVSDEAPKVDAVEAEGWVLRWISLDDLDGPLYPEGLLELLRRSE